MKISEAYQKPGLKPGEQRCTRTGEIIPACTGVKHWWFYRTASVQECKYCGEKRLVQR